MVYKRLYKKLKKNKNKNKKTCIVECNCQSCSLDPNGYKKVSKATRTRHRTKDKEQSEIDQQQLINENFDHHEDIDFDESSDQEISHQRFINENFESLMAYFLIGAFIKINIFVMIKEISHQRFINESL